MNRFQQTAQAIKTGAQTAKQAAVRVQKSSFLKEFRDFAMKGNVIDLAVGVMIGAAFGKIVSSLVDDVVMPALSLITGKVNFSNLFYAFSDKEFATVADAKAAGVVTIAYGSFLNNVINFVIIAFIIFLIVRVIYRMKRKEEKKPDATTKSCGFCFETIDIRAVRCPKCTSALEQQQA